MPTVIEPSHPRYVIVVGTDFSDASSSALEEAAQLAERAGESELHLVHVMAAQALPASLGLTDAGGASHIPGIDESSRALRAWLEPLRTRRTRLAGHIRMGKADREIAQLASDVGADVVVVGTHSKQGLTRLLLGSVAESLVRHAPCAVLAHRPKAVHTVHTWELIEAPCPDCLQVRQETARRSLWCERHSEHHGRAHTYHDYPDTYAMGSQSFRS